eukprot:TRINITY_DN19680_c0_g1_i1.p1 TRINITY_DN19680_c0_g1~~TRINITY_DN19680_c0_g1_i1.p1  ORF type:complete len:277 (-),score=31.58 TRINITY_DN19680_c0_g1_i1:109-900(-)
MAGAKKQTTLKVIKASCCNKQHVPIRPAAKSRGVKRTCLKAEKPAGSRSKTVSRLSAALLQVAATGKQSFSVALDGHGSRVDYDPHFADSKAADTWLKALIKSVPWSQGKIKFFGKEINEPRLTCYAGDKPYAYSGRQLSPVPWSKVPILQKIREQVEKVTGDSFNSVLCNRYRSGDDSMGWHSDNESVYGPNPTIASVTFGAERDFDFRETGKRPGHLRVHLSHGSLLVMSGSTQDYWQHALPRRKKISTERINLTFRKVVT